MRRTDQLFFEMMGPLLYVAAGLVVLTVLVYAIRSLYRDDADNAADGLGMLTDYREMLRRGELTEEEYRFIKSRAVSRIDSRAPATNEQKISPEAHATNDAASTGAVLIVGMMQPGSPLSPFPVTGHTTPPGPPLA